MQQNTLPRMAMLLVAVSLLFAYCKKGDQGPEGPAGPEGPQGPPGTANVIYSGWQDVTFAPDKNQNGDTIGYEIEIPAPKLTSSIINNGEMKVYINAGSAASPVVYPLPYVDVYFGGNIDVAFLVGKIALYANFDASTYTENNVKYQQYRYILIPGGTQARIAQPDWTDYNKVKAFYNLPD